MAGELIHSSVGTTMTQVEFEAVGLHVCNSQATGDLIYASSATQLSRLAIGATNKVLTVIGGVPTWQSTLAGLTLTSVAGLSLVSGNVISVATVDDGWMAIYGGASVYSARIDLRGKDFAGNPGEIWLRTPDAAKTSAVTRVQFTGAADITTVVWAACTHTNIKLTGAANAFGAYVLATGAGKTVDNVITALQALGLVTQA